LKENCCLKQENSSALKKRLVCDRKLLLKTRRFFCIEENSFVYKKRLVCKRKLLLEIRKFFCAEEASCI
jgi:hypothetical protein